MHFMTFLLFSAYFIKFSIENSQSRLLRCCLVACLSLILTPHIFMSKSSFVIDCNGMAFAFHADLRNNCFLLWSITKELVCLPYPEISKSSLLCTKREILCKIKKQLNSVNSFLHCSSCLCVHKTFLKYFQLLFSSLISLALSHFLAKYKQKKDMMMRVSDYHKMHNYACTPRLTRCSLIMVLM